MRRLKGDSRCLDQEADELREVEVENCYCDQCGGPLHSSPAPVIGFAAGDEELGMIIDSGKGRSESG